MKLLGCWNDARQPLLVCQKTLELSHLACQRLGAKPGDQGEELDRVRQSSTCRPCGKAAVQAGSASSPMRYVSVWSADCHDVAPSLLLTRGMPTPYRLWHARSRQRRGRPPPPPPHPRVPRRAPP